MINNIAEAKGLNKEEVLEKYKKIVSSSGYTKYKLYGICVDEKEVISIFDPLVFRRMENITEYYDPVDDKHKYKLLAVRASRPAKTQSEGGALGFNQEYVYHQLQIKKKDIQAFADSLNKQN
jgi:hypothetical protein